MLVVYKDVAKNLKHAQRAHCVRQGLLRLLARLWCHLKHGGGRCLRQLIPTFTFERPLDLQELFGQQRMSFRRPICVCRLERVLKLAHTRRESVYLLVQDLSIR